MKENIALLIVFILSFSYFKFIQNLNLETIDAYKITMGIILIVIFILLYIIIIIEEKPNLLFKNITIVILIFIIYFFNYLLFTKTGFKDYKIISYSIVKSDKNKNSLKLKLENNITILTEKENLLIKHKIIEDLETIENNKKECYFPIENNKKIIFYYLLDRIFCIEKIENIKKCIHKKAK